jgi:hypothetical protein
MTAVADMTMEQAGASEASPFRADELAIQARAGVTALADAVGRPSIRDFMPQQHRQFFPQLPFFFIGALEAGGQPCAAMLAADADFIDTPDERTLQVGALPLPGKQEGQVCRSDTAATVPRFSL